MMVSLIFPVLVVLGQCPGGTCPAPAARSAPTVVSYNYSYSGPGISYSSRVEASDNGNCTTQRRGFFKRLFRKR